MGFMIHLGFPISCAYDRLEEYVCHIDGLDENTSQKCTYTRDEARLGWVTKQFGPQRLGGINETGYDFVEAICDWVQERGKPEASVCEILQAEGNPHVRTANVFYSHGQKQRPDVMLDFMIIGCMAHAASLPPMNEIVMWLDFTSLRQCVDDFNVDRIRALIAGINCTMAELGKTHMEEPGSGRYLERVFCIFELLSTIESNSTLLCQMNMKLARGMEHWLEEHPVRSRHAKSRDSTHEAMIKSFIERSIGFKELDKVITKAMTDGAVRVLDMVDTPP